MATDKFDKACQLITQSSSLANFHGGKSGDAVEKAQKMLQVKFPKSYISFLRIFGAGQIGFHELYGLVDENCLAAGIPNVVWVTLEERRLGLPSTYVVVEVPGDGVLYCLETSAMNDEHECALIACIPQSLAEPHKIASSFGEFFLDCANDASVAAAAKG